MHFRLHCKPLNLKRSKTAAANTGIVYDDDPVGFRCVERYTLDTVDELEIMCQATETFSKP